MKRVVILIVLIAAGYGGYYYYTHNATPLPRTISSRLSSSQVELTRTDFMQVLGATTSNLVAKGTDALNAATRGQAEPVINKVVSDLQDKVKNLPEQEYKRVKYEFCKDVIPSENDGKKPL